MVGGGIAGQAVCEAVRARDPDVPLTLVCGEPHRPYDRVRLGDAPGARARRRALRLRPDAWYEDAGVQVLCGDARRRRSTPAGTATLDDGAELHFQRAVLCTGSDALVPPFAGADAAGRRMCSATRPTAQAIVAAARPAARARRRDRRRPARPRGRLRARAPRLPDDRRAPRRPADGAPARRAGRGAARARDRGARRGRSPRARHAAVAAGPDGRVAGLASPTATTLDCDLVVVAAASGRTSASPATPGWTSSAASSSTTRSPPRIPTCSRSASAPSTAASCTASSRRSTTRPRSRRRCSPARERPLRGLDPDGQAEGDGRRPGHAPGPPRASARWSPPTPPRAPTASS